MTLQEFINEHRTMINDYIIELTGAERHIDAQGNLKISDAEREDFIMNDEELYNLAIESCGLESEYGRD